MTMPGRVMRLLLLARPRREIRQLRQRDVHAERARARVIRTKRLRVSAATACRRHHVAHQQLRPDVGGHRARPHHLAVREHHAGGTAILHQHLAHRRRCPDLGARALGRPRHRLRDRTHAADRVPPDARPCRSPRRSSDAAARRPCPASRATHRRRRCRRRRKLAFTTSLSNHSSRNAAALFVKRSAITCFSASGMPNVRRPDGRGTNRLEQSAAGIRRRLQHQIAQHACSLSSAAS